MNPRKFFIGRAIGLIVVIIILGFGYLLFGKKAISPVTDQPQESNLSQVYTNSEYGFTLHFPNAAASTSQSYRVDETYAYQLAPGKVIHGVKFTIPHARAEGTNLSNDSYISVESIPQTEMCGAELFLDGDHGPQPLTENGVTYTFATSINAGAGNRYEETVYAIDGTNPCVAVRYFIHFGVIQNYPEGTVKEFDKVALVKEFDEIRKSLVIQQ